MNQGKPANSSSSDPKALIIAVTQRFKNSSKFMKQRVRQGRVRGTSAASRRQGKRLLDVLGEHIPGNNVVLLWPVTTMTGVYSALQIL